MFVQKINPLTGEADWVLVNDPGLGDEDDASADLVATSSYLDMLTDSRRNAAYAAALRRVIPAKQRAATAAAAAATPASGAAAPAAEGSAAAAVATAQGVRVLDIGTGTGLLAMLAARALGVQTAAPVEGAAAAAAEGGKEAGEKGEEGAGKAPAAPLDAPVVACEVFPPMQTLARRVIASNGLAGAIRLVDKRSDEIKLQTAAAAAAPAGDSTAGRQAAARAKLAAAAAGGAANLKPDMSEKVDVIVTEIFDSELLGEGMVPTMRHAVQHLLKEGGAVIPATSRLYGQLLQCPLMANMTGLRSADGGAAATPWSGPDGAAAAANHVLGTLAAMDAAARQAFYKGDELYEVREMHVDLLTSSSAPASSSAHAASAPAPGSPAPLLLPLSEPFPVFDFDWAAPPPASGRKATIQVPVTADGTAHAVLLWWQLGMTKEGPAEAAESGSGSGEGPALLLSTAPGWVQGRPEAGGDGGPLGGFEQRWRDHWKQCWAQLAPEAPALRAGDSVSLRFEHDDLNVRTRMLGAHLASASASTSTPASTPPPASSQAQAGAAGEAGAHPGPHAGAHPTAHAKEVLAALRAEAAQSARLMPLLNCLAPQALLQLGDRPRLASFGRALQAALDSAASSSAPASSPASPSSPGAEVVVVDGSLALGLLAATHPGVASVTLLQESSMAAGEWLTAAAERLGVASKIRSVRAEAYFKRLAARPSAPAATAFAPAASGATAAATAGSAEASTSGAVATAVAAPAAAAGPGPLVLAAEPYYSEFEQLVPWAHLKFWRDFDVLRDATAGKGKGSKGAGAKGGAAAAGAAGGAQGPRPVACFPSGARLVAAAASLPELWRTRCALDNIEGLDLSTANAVLGVVGGEDGPEAEGEGEGAEPSGKDKGQSKGQSKGGNASGSGDDGEDVWGDDDGSGSDDSAGGGGKGAARQPLPVLPYSIWQAGGGYEELSARSELLRLDCSSHLDDVEGGAVLTAVRPGVCHAVVLWMEYDLAPPSGSGRSELSVTTGPLPDGGPTAAVQGVYLLRKPYELKPGSRIHVEANFDGLDADIAVDVTLLP